MVRFHTGHANYKIVYGEGSIRFVNGVYETNDPDEVEFLMAACKRSPDDVWLDKAEGTFICPVCFKACSTKLALDGHMRSHKGVKDEPQSDGGQDAGEDS